MVTETESDERWSKREKEGEISDRRFPYYEIRMNTRQAQKPIQKCIIYIQHQANAHSCAYVYPYISVVRSLRTLRLYAALYMHRQAFCEWGGMISIYARETNSITFFEQ